MFDLPRVGRKGKWPLHAEPQGGSVRSDIPVQEERGVFPVDRIAKVIDGRTQIAAHGSRDMPIWGKRWAVNAAEHYVDAPYDQEAYVRAQALSVIDYLNRIQQK
ncbi:hypothetical protein [Bradyrhizobium symbiodeficiens]|uniref:hypothetical protein n=1 Tax=Bradyrhizobium symbiodeficiens TaxID=1404367 RepID=UPI002FE58080